MENSEKTKVIWTPSKTGSYKILVKVTDAQGNKAQSYSYYKISSSLEVTKFKLSKSKIKAGKKVKITAKASSNTTVKYQFKIKKQGSKKVTILKKYSTKNTCTIKVNKKGTYIDGLRISDVNVKQLNLDYKSTLKFEFAVDENGKIFVTYSAKQMLP